MAVLLHFALGRFPPFFPVIADHVRHERLLDLIHRRLAVKAVQHDFDQVQVMRRQMADGFQVRRLAGENVVLGDGLERFGRKRQIHRMARLAREINGETRKHRVHGLDLSEPPTAMGTIAALDQLVSAVPHVVLRFFPPPPVFRILLS